MYKLITTTRYKHSYKRLKRSGRLKDLWELDKVLEILESGEELPSGYFDHQLTGNLQHLRECHVRGNLLLTYQKINNLLIISLANIGTHHELFGN